MADTDTIEWRLLGADLVTVLGILPAVSSNLYLQLNEPGSGELKIALLSGIAPNVVSGAFAQASYRGAVRGGFFVENIKKINADNNEESGQFISLSGRGPLALLDDAIVWDDGTGATTRDFTNQTKAAILKTLIDEAKARGALANLTYNFTATTDSVGITWADSVTLKFNVGASLLDVARQLAKLGIDFDIAPGVGNFVLSAYKNGKGTDKSNTVYFRVGVNCEEMSGLEAGGEIKNVLRVKYPAGFTFVSDAPSITARRRREKLMDAGYAQTSADALTFGQAHLAKSKDPQYSIMVKLYDGAGPRAFADYSIGDYVMLDNKGVEMKYRVNGMPLSWTDMMYADVAVDLNSTILENEIRMAQAIANLQNLWTTAHDANLMEVSFWAAIGAASDDATRINCLFLDGTKLYVGGRFTKIGGMDLPSYGIAVYDISSGVWSALASGLSGVVEVNAICKIGSDIYVGSNSSIVYKWNGSAWSIVGTLGYLESIYALATDGTNLYAGGNFSEMNGNVAIQMAAKYTVATSAWSALGSNPNGPVRSMLFSGGNLYVGGDFTSAGGVGGTARVAKWNGTTWSALASGLDGSVYALSVYGTHILAGGAFTGKIAEWDGAAWSIFGGGVNNTVYGLAVYLTDVYAIGTFTDAGSFIAKWNGAGWSKLDQGLNNTGYTIVLNNQDVYVGGLFTVAGDKNVVRLAAYFTSFESLANYLSNSGATFDMAAAIHNAPAKTSIIAADEIGFWDSISGKLRKNNWTNILASIKTYADTIYAAIIHIHAAGDIVSGTIATARLGSGAANNTTYLRGDQTWATPATGGTPGGANKQVQFNDAGAFGGDPNFIWDKVSKNFQIGNYTVQSFLSGITNYFHNIAVGASSSFLLTAYGTGFWPRLEFYRARGTDASSTAVQSGDVLASIAVRPYDGTGWPNYFGTIQCIATENWDATHHGCKWVLVTTPNGTSSPATAVTFNPDGSLDVASHKITSVANGVAATDAATVGQIIGLPSWTAPTLSGSWVNYGGTYAPAGYWKDGVGRVHLRGLVKNGAMPSSIFTLPVGYRPAYTLEVLVDAGGAVGICVINIDGTVVAGAGSTAYWSLDGIIIYT